MATQQHIDLFMSNFDSMTINKKITLFKTTLSNQKRIADLESQLNLSSSSLHVHNKVNHDHGDVGNYGDGDGDGDDDGDGDGGGGGGGSDGDGGDGNGNGGGGGDGNGNGNGNYIKGSRKILQSRLSTGVIIMITGITILVSIFVILRLKRHIQHIQNQHRSVIDKN